MAKNQLFAAGKTTTGKTNSNARSVEQYQPAQKLTYQLITNSSDLQLHLQRFAPDETIFIDCEFQHERKFYAHLCLVQLANANSVLLIDPLELGSDFDLFNRFLRQHNGTKVLHASEQDLLIFRKLLGIWLSGVFDTQLAAAFLGYGNSISYANLVQRLCKIKLGKQRQVTKWLHRPLTTEQLDYAAADVWYLRDIYYLLRQALQQQQRHLWMQEEWANKQQQLNNLINPKLAWRRIKGYEKYRKILPWIIAIAEWRELTSQQLDQPRSQILPDHALIELAQARPSAIADVKKLRFFPPGLLGRNSQRASQLTALLAIINDPETATINPDEIFDQGRRQNKLTATEEGKLDLLKLLLRDISRQHKVAANYIANDHDLLKLVKGQTPAKFTHGWRQEIIGKTAGNLLNGKLAVKVNPKGLGWFDMESVSS